MGRVDGKWLEAILTDPTADAPRLVFADQLIAQRDPRGQFIALQCAMVRTESMLETESELLKQHATEWLGGLELENVEWRRGFPVKGSLAVHLLTSEALARVPLESVRLTQFKKMDEAFFSAKPHPTVRSFQFGSAFSDLHCRALSAPLFARAVSFDFSSGTFATSALFDELVKGQFARLEELVLDGTPLNDVALSNLSRTKFWSRLASLSLANTPALTPMMATSLTAATSLRTLKLKLELDERWGVSLLKHAPRSLRTVEATISKLPPLLRGQLEKRFSFEPEPLGATALGSYTGTNSSQP